MLPKSCVLSFGLRGFANFYRKMTACLLAHKRKTDVIANARLI